MKYIKLFPYLLISGLLLLITCKKEEIRVETNSPSYITNTTAQVSGNIINGAGAKQHGHCYARTPNPTVTGKRTELGVPAGSGTFTSFLQGLEPGTKYYVKAYISDENTTVYGLEINFTTELSVPPVITTTAVSNIRMTSAVSGGNIISQGATLVTARGVCWSSSANPTISNSVTIDGSGTGAFSSYLTGLTASTKYYVKAYATNSGGTYYGEQVSFTTTSGLPEVYSSVVVSNITATSARFCGYCSSVGETQVMARGVCWATFPNPTPDDNKIIIGWGIGGDCVNITGLTPVTTYYIRAYATNSIGTAYAENYSFTTTL
jgi:hypothetical protein